MAGGGGGGGGGWGLEQRCPGWQKIEKLTIGGGGGGNYSGLESKLLFNIFYCFCMFVNKDFIHFGCA